MADYSDAIQFLVGTFKLPADIFTWPNFVFYLIIPMIALIVIWYSLLYRWLKIIHHSGISFGLAIIFSIFMIPFVYFIPASFLLIAAIVSYFLLGGGLTKTNLIIAIALGALVFFGYPILVTLIESNLNY